MMAAGSARKARVQVSLRQFLSECGLLVSCEVAARSAPTDVDLSAGTPVLGVASS